LGIGVGGAASFVVARWIASLLYGTEPPIPFFTLMISTLGAGALLAGQIPAHRASRIDPMTVLRGL
ncbi:MAG TPA: hypothetical protein VG345_04885, partial [Bryobacteraceae bacterium]|nr:hypothetical protein [Bryobacteraceae bacterium]